MSRATTVRGQLLGSESVYVIVVNDVRRGPNRTRAHEIVDFLFRRNVWIFGDQAPYLSKFRKGDKLIIYLGGRFGTFEAEAQIASEVFPIEAKLMEEVQALGLTWFTKHVRISNIRRLNPPRPIRDLIPKLNFISDKRNFGLSLRVGIRRLDADDARMILE